MGCGDFFSDPISLATGGIVNGQGQVNPMGMLGGGMMGGGMMNPMEWFMGGMSGNRSQLQPNWGNLYAFMNKPSSYTPSSYGSTPGMYDKYYNQSPFDAAYNALQTSINDSKYNEQSVADAIKGLGTDTTYQGHDRLWRNYNQLPHGQQGLTQRPQQNVNALASRRPTQPPLTGRGPQPYNKPPTEPVAYPFQPPPPSGNTETYYPFQPPPPQGYFPPQTGPMNSNGQPMGIL